ncbi:MAG: Smr/MutS family protein [Bacilli bacterium]|nr:Smr/MutS family protein [Bacilli bacterium]
MSRITRDPFTYRFPHLDIHGETTTTCIAIINSFLKDNIKLKQKNVIIIHGKGSGALKKATHEHLKKLKIVNKYYIDGMNDGQTIVELDI